MHYELLYPSLYIRAADLHGKDVTLTIDRIEVMELQRADGSKEKKPCVFFAETVKKARENGEPDKAKRLVMNKTNARTVAGLYGTETDEWVGKKVILYAAMVSAFGKQTEAIRIRAEKPKEK